MQCQIMCSGCTEYKKKIFFTSNANHLYSGVIILMFPQPKCVQEVTKAYMFNEGPKWHKIRSTRPRVRVLDDAGQISLTKIIL